MSPRLLLLKIITMLHLESHIPGETSRSVDLVNDLLQGVKIPEAEVGLIDSEREIIGSLYNICRKISSSQIGEEIGKSDLLQEVRLHCGTEIDLFESFKEGLEEELTEEGLKKRVNYLRKELRSYLNYEATKKKIYEVSNTLRFKETSIDNMEDYLRDFVAEIESTIQKTSKVDSAILGEINSENIETVVKVATNVQDEDTGVGKLQFHLQDLNDMCNGGLRRGEMLFTSALPHMNKTGFTLDMFAGIAMNNEPYLFDKTKKPLLLRISFEDDVELNFAHLYRHLYEWETGLAATTTDKEPKELADFVMERLTRTGFHIRMIKVDPINWTIFDVFAYIRELQADGYEVALCMLDYMRKMPTTGCVQGIAGADVRDMARRFRSFLSANKIAGVTPHQISTQGKEINRAIPKDFVKMLPNGGYYDGCKSLDAEIDLEIFQHIEKQNGFSYLTLQRGKHRGAPIISEESKYLVYQFHDIGGIPPDVGKERTGLRRVGGKPAGQSDSDFDWI